MMRRPRFRRDTRSAILPAEGVLLLSERGHVLLRGRAFAALAPLLDGERTEEEIADRLAGKLSPAEVFYAIDLLRRGGHVVDAAPEVAPERAAFWDAAGVAPGEAEERLREAAVSLDAVAGAAGMEAIRDALAALGVRAGGAREALRVIVAEDYLRPEIDAENRRALADRSPWMLVKPAGAVIWIGPIFVPGETGCWDCLRHRLDGHRKVDRYLAARGIRPAASAVPALPATIATAAGLTATIAARWIARGRDPAIEGRVLTLDVISLEKRDHLLTRRPQCPSCGDPTALRAAQEAPVRLAARAKAFTADGGHRAVTPRATLAALERHVSPVTGIVSALRRSDLVADPEEMLISYAADHIGVPMGAHLASLGEGLAILAGGKGRHDAQARASALGEAIERYASTFQGDEPVVRASLAQLGAEAVAPNASMLFSEAQMAEAAARPERRPRQAWVAAPLPADAEIEWIPAWSLTRDARRYLPAALVYLGYGEVRGDPFARADSNGCAAGNTVEEAILQGFMELVERDGVALWWHNRLRRPAVDLDSFDEPFFRDLRRRHDALGRDLWVLDLTSDLGIPTFAAVSRRRAAPEGIVAGYGAHFDARLAVMRALTEVNQVLPAASPGGGGFWDTATVADHPYLAPDPAQAARTAAAFPRPGSDDLAADVRTAVRLASERGVEVIVADLTRPDAGLAVVRVVAPGLRHFWPRFGPGRLYDVPVRMGWAPHALAEADLNRAPVWR